MISLQEYFNSSLAGVFSNGLFMGIILGMLVQDIRNSKYLSWERFVRGDDFEGEIKRGFFYLLSYIVAVPLGIIALSIIIFFLWILSAIVG